MEFVLQGNDCYLKIYNIEVFESDLEYPINTVAAVSVLSNGFSGSVEFDLNIRSLANFSSEIKKMYETLNGHAELKEPYGFSNIMIKAETMGHFTISGKLDLTYPPNSLTFEFDIDQTMLKSFSENLYSNFDKYLPR